MVFSLSSEKEEGVAVLCRRLGVKAAYLFGSAARGETGPLSDLDVGLLLDASPAGRSDHDLRLEATAQLMHLFHAPRVDVVILNAASPLMRFRVIQQGRLLFDRDPKARIAFEAKTIRDFCDTQPLRRTYDQQLLRAIRSGRFYG